MAQAEQIRQILRAGRTVAVVGLSPRRERASYEVAQYLQSRGWRIVPVNPQAAASGLSILGEPAYASLTEAARHTRIDLVNVFRQSQHVLALVQEAIALGLPAVWLQLGIESAPAAALAQAAGLPLVQNHCLKVEHARAG